LLNQDTIVQTGWLAGLLDAFDDPNVGIAGGKALYPDGRIQHAGGYVDVQGNAAHYGYRQADAGQFDESREVDYVTGATLAISRSAYEKIGGLDEGFVPAYYEDVDWCLRAREAGFRVLYAPTAVLVHRERSGYADSSHTWIYALHRNRLRLVLKHSTLDRIVGEFQDAERRWLRGLGEGSEELVSAASHAYLHHLLHLDEMMSARLTTLGVPLQDAEPIASVLLALRTASSIATSPALKERHAAALEQLREREAVVESWRPARLPIFGPALDLIRRLWNRTITAAYVLPMAERQTEFNTRIVTLLDEILQNPQLSKQSEAALREQGRELADLAYELSKLRADVGGINPES